MHKPIKDVDELLKSSTDPEAAFRRLMKRARVIEKVPDNTPASNKGGDSGRLYHFESFKVIGEDEDEKLVFWSLVNRKIYITSLRDFTMDKLVQIGGTEIIGRVANRSPQDGQISFRTLKKNLIYQASQKQIGQLRWIGQGIHILKKDRLLIVNGEEVHTWNGKSFKLYDSPVIEGKLIRANMGKTWIDFESMKKRVLKMTKDRAREILKKALGIVDQWGFSSNWDVPLVVGFLLSQIVQSVWIWRPHMWITASQGSGKTLLIEFFEAVGGELAMRREGQVLTEAGFRQDIGNDSRLCYIDEFERSDSSRPIIEYLRSSNRGGFAVKGSANQKPIYFYIRHSVLVASIEVSLSKAAEKSRYILIELEKDISRNPVIPNSLEMEELRLDLFSFSLWASLQAKKLINQVGRIEGLESRLTDCFGVPLSMIAIIDDNPVESLKKLILSAIDDRNKQERDSVLEDEVQLIRDILSSKIRVNETGLDHRGLDTSKGYRDMTVSQLMESPEFYDTDLQANGIKICEDGFFLVPDNVARSLLKDTRWKGAQLYTMLKRLPGAQSKRRRVAGCNSYGLLLPNIEALETEQQNTNRTPTEHPN